MGRCVGILSLVIRQISVQNLCLDLFFQHQSINGPLLLLRFLILHVLGPNGQLRWYTVTSNKADISVEIVSEFILPTSKHRWSTAITLLPNAFGLFICGDRRGSVHLYSKG